MANRRWTNSKIFSMHTMPVAIDCSVAIGATGAVGTITQAQSTVKSVTRLAAGTYQIQLADMYAGLFNAWGYLMSPQTGSNVNGGSFVTGTTYQITALGNTTGAQWITAGLAANVTPAVGATFVAAGAGAGTGTVKAIGLSGVNNVEVIAFQNPNDQSGSYIIVQCQGATNSSTTTPKAVDPAQGSSLFMEFYLNNSSLP